MRGASPPRLTLFPYTTLFRSRRDGLSARRLEGGGEGAHAARERLAIGGEAVAGLGRGVARAEVDRESTRLNSSHLGIAYAVCCWEKETGVGARVAVHEVVGGR